MTWFRFGNSSLINCNQIKYIEKSFNYLYLTFTCGEIKTIVFNTEIECKNKFMEIFKSLQK